MSTHESDEWLTEDHSFHENGKISGTFDVLCNVQAGISAEDVSILAPNGPTMTML